jgi:hypothetical protein
VKRLLLVVPLLALTACSTPLTPQRVAPSFQEAFTGLYVEQQVLLGRDSVDRAGLHVLASCRRTGSDPNGPGEDWVCAVQYTDLGTSSTQSFELQVKPDGCWKADGAPSVQPAKVVDPITQLTTANPLAEFDGCLDTSW